MAEQTPYQALRAEREAAKQEGKPNPVRRRPYGLDPVTKKARQAEMNRRTAETRRRATTILALRHKAEFDEIYAAEAQGVAAERGPLPGDPDYTPKEN